MRARPAGALADAELAEGFKILNEYAEGLYSVVLAETGGWAGNLLDEIKNYRGRIDQKTSGPTIGKL
jgi:hypothetical protein